MAKDFSTMEDSNRSSNPSIHEISDPRRRIVVGGGLSALAACMVPWLSGCASPVQGADASPLRIGFKPVPPARDDRVTVPEGYTAVASFA